MIQIASPSPTQSPGTRERREVPSEKLCKPMGKVPVRSFLKRCGQGNFCFRESTKVPCDTLSQGVSEVKIKEL